MARLLPPNAAARARLNPWPDRAPQLPPAEPSAWLDALPAAFTRCKQRLRASWLQARDDVAGAGAPPVPGIDCSVDDRAPSSHHAGQTVGAYRLLRQLGSGGMGTVWLAERSDGMLKRPVALKLPCAGVDAHGLAARLAREREILAVLDHPHIAKLYDAGFTADGQPYLALEHVQGEPIDAHCRRYAGDLRPRLRLLLQVAQAVAHAHANLVVHRDLKPANILVTDSGQVRLLDFGIAKLLGAEAGKNSELTQQHGRALTLHYASPEQILKRPIGTASDVYSLGVVMYELLCGMSPYRLRRDSRAALEDAIVHDEPLRPSVVAGDARLRRQLRGDLDTIVLKALKKDGAQRYATVQALADDLRRHFCNQPVLARPPSWRYRALRFGQRHVHVIGAVAAVLLALAAGAAATLWQVSERHTQTGALEQTRGFIVSILADADPYLEPARVLPARQVLDRARERLDTLPAARADMRVELLNLIGWTLLRLQRSEDGATVVAQALRESRAKLPSDHAQALRARVIQLVVLRYRGQPQRMRAEIDRLLPLLRRRAGADPFDLIITLRNDANLAATSELRPDHAMRAAAEALALSRARFGDAHPETVMSHAVLVGAARVAVAPEEALEISSEGIELAERVYGGRGPNAMLLQMRTMHAGALAQAGRLEPAIRLARQNLADGPTVFGPDTLGEGYDWSSLASMVTATGDLDAALAAVERAHALFERLAPESTNTASAIGQRGVVHLLAGRTELALADFTAAGARHAGLLGQAHATTRANTALHALALARSGRPADALRELAPLQAGPFASAGDFGLVHHAAGVAYLQSADPDPDRALSEQRQALDAAERAAASPGGLRHGWLAAAASVEAGHALRAIQRRSPAAATFAAGAIVVPVDGR